MHRKSSVEETRKEIMKTVTAKMLVSLIGVLLVAPFFVVALIVGARAVALSHGSSDDLLMVALALGGAAASVVNGMGRRTVKERRASANSDTTDEAALSKASMIHLGY
jgi:hypothetical protein